MRTINFENNEILPLTKEQHEPYENIKICYICEKNERKYTEDKNYHKVKDYCHYTRN